MAEVEQKHLAQALNIVKRCAMWDRSEPEEDPEEVIAQALADAEARGRESAQGDWVAVSERLPVHGQSVLFWGKGWVPGAVYGIGRFLVDSWERQQFEDETDQEEDGPRMYAAADVTHWHPLPPPPRNEASGETTTATASKSDTPPRQ